MRAADLAGRLERRRRDEDCEPAQRAPPPGPTTMARPPNPATHATSAAPGGRRMPRTPSMSSTHSGTEPMTSAARPASRCSSAIAIRPIEPIHGPTIAEPTIARRPVRGRRRPHETQPAAEHHAGHQEARAHPEQGRDRPHEHGDRRVRPRPTRRRRSGARQDRTGTRRGYPRLPGCERQLRAERDERAGERPAHPRHDARPLDDVSSTPAANTP